MTIMREFGPEDMWVVRFVLVMVVAVVLVGLVSGFGVLWWLW